MWNWYLFTVKVISSSSASSVSIFGIFSLRKCTPDTLCGHGEGECRLNRIRTREVCLKIELSSSIQTFSSNSDCDNTGVYHICETNCLDRYFLHSKCTVGGILVTCEYLHWFVFVFVLLNSDGKHMMSGIMVT